MRASTVGCTKVGQGYQDPDQPPGGCGGGLCMWVSTPTPGSLNWPSRGQRPISQTLPIFDRFRHCPLEACNSSYKRSFGIKLLGFLLLFGPYKTAKRKLFATSLNWEQCFQTFQYLNRCGKISLRKLHMGPILSCRALNLLQNYTM